MPAGTVYAKYEPCVFDELAIKDETIMSDGRSIDWFYQDFIPMFESTNDSGSWMNSLDQMAETGSSEVLDYDCTGRDGCFDQDQLFAVFDDSDVVNLIERLQKARASAQQGLRQVA